MAKSLAGHFLIAGKHLRDSNFYRTVVLLVEQGSGGAMGLVINRPTTISVARALEGHFELPETGSVVYSGGPVEQSALFILHDSSQFDGKESPVVPGLYVGSTAQVFEDVVRSAAAGNAELRFRIFAGCAGWAAKQLEGELANGDWLVIPANMNDIFHDNPYAVYEACLRRASRTDDLLPQPVAHPEWN